MQSVSSRIWTLVTVSISYDDNHYTTGTSYQKIIYSQLDIKLGQLTKEELDTALKNN